MHVHGAPGRELRSCVRQQAQEHVQATCRPQQFGRGEPVAALDPFPPDPDEIYRAALAGTSAARRTVLRMHAAYAGRPVGWHDRDGILLVNDARYDRAGHDGAVSWQSEDPIDAQAKELAGAESFVAAGALVQVSAQSPQTSVRGISCLHGENGDVTQRAARQEG